MSGPFEPGAARVVVPADLGLELLRRGDRLAPVEVRLQVRPVDHLVHDQDLRELLEEPSVSCEHLGGAVVGLVHEPGGLLVDQRRQVVRELGGAARVQEPGAGAEPVVPERHRADLRAHAVLGHHGPGNLGGALEVVLRSVETTRSNRISSAVRPPEEHRESVLELGLGEQVSILERSLHRHPQRRRAARDDRDPVDGSAVSAVRATSA
jgi:hypothetical protein